MDRLKADVAPALRFLGRHAGFGMEYVAKAVIGATFVATEFGLCIAGIATGFGVPFESRHVAQTAYDNLMMKGLAPEALWASRGAELIGAIGGIGGTALMLAGAVVMAKAYREAIDIIEDGNGALQILCAKPQSSGKITIMPS